MNTLTIGLKQLLDLEVISLNVRGIRGDDKRRKLSQYLKKQVSSKGIIFLEETHSTKDKESQWANYWNERGHLKCSNGDYDARGVLISIREGLDCTIEAEYTDTAGRFIILECLIQGSQILLINLYNLNNEEEQVSVIAKLLQAIQLINSNHGYEVILGGDFNFIFDIKTDSDGGGKPKLKLSSIAAINQVTKSRDLVDIWRLRHPERKRFTFRQPKPLIQRRLDFFLISNSMQDNVRTVDILPAINKDHSTIYLRLQSISSKNKGNSHWKFNNSLLNNPEFVSQMREKIPNFVSVFSNTSDSLDPRVKWEFLKYKMKIFSRQFSMQLKHVRESSRLNLEKKTERTW